MKRYIFLIMFLLMAVNVNAGTIHSYDHKSPPDDADEIVIYDSDDGSTKKIQVGDISGSGGTASGWTDGGTNIYPTDTTDNVSIGTTTPNAASLEVVKQGSTIPLKISSSATGNGDYMVVTSGGAVGIGTTNPLAVNNQFYLNLYKSFDGLRAFSITNPNTGTGARAGVELATADSNGYIREYPTNYATASQAGRTELLNENGNGLLIGINAGDIGFTTNFGGRAMTITNAGRNVGIGTVGPVQKLEVVGTVKATSFIGDGSSLTGISASSGWTDTGTAIYATDTTERVGIGTTVPLATLNVVKSGTDQPFMVSSTAGANGDYLVVNSQGAVGIGTTNPLAANNQLYLNLYKNFDGLRSIAVINPNTGTGARSGVEVVSSDSNGYIREYPTNYSIASQAGRTEILNEVGNGLNIGINSGDIAFTTNFGGRAMTIMNASRSIGIGTVDPVAKLAVVGTGGVGIGTIGTGSYIRTSPPSGGLIVQGNTGIGTYLPGAKLDVVGSIRAFTATSPLTKKTGANIACNTTCAGTMCIWAQNTADFSLVDCADATADACGCLGP